MPGPTPAMIANALEDILNSNEGRRILNCSRIALGAISNLDSARA